MAELIGAKITSLCNTIIPVYYSEAETGSYPYMVYDQVVTEKRNKDGAYKLVSEAELKVISNDFDEADGKAALVAAALANGLTGSFSYRAGMVSKDCVDQVWTIQMNYTITQKL